jgi:hypothetical protein
MKVKPHGRCALTGQEGPFVKAHILPAGLTRPRTRGEFFIQGGIKDRPIKRWTSWYDQRLVTASGEKILSDLDDWGIKTLRKHKLVWSSFDGPKCEFDDWIQMDAEGRGIRVVEGIDTEKLRLFFLSLLWRAAASRLSEFAAVQVSPAKLRSLGRMIVSGRSEPRVLFSLSLTQISSKGPFHNMAPDAEKRPSTTNRNARKIPIFRFFLDGLVVHYHRRVDHREIKAAGGLAVGASAKLGVITIPYEVSAQQDRFDFLSQHVETEWPDELRVLARPSS